MNIIKLNDRIMPNECRFSQFFNEELKGKYAYWIKMRYIFPLDSLDNRTYIKYEQMCEEDFINEDIPQYIDIYSEECNMFNFAQNYVDHNYTELANSIVAYKTSNDYVADPDIDISKLRKFRSWLAEEILKFYSNNDGEYIGDLDNNYLHVLEYYKNNMYNDIIKYLSVFGSNTEMFNITKSDCGCCSNTSTISTLQLSNTLTCNAIDIYRKNIHNVMVQLFSDVNFWNKFHKDFIGLFKKYVDNIIKTGLIVSISDKVNLYTVCNCSDKSNDSYVSILKNLSEALEYIKNDDVKNHNNFIYDALYNWADKLYDYMFWEIK